MSSLAAAAGGGPADVSLAAVVHDICVLEAIKPVLRTAGHLNARRRLIANARADLPAPAKPVAKDVSSFLAARASKISDTPEQQELRAALDVEAPEVRSSC